MCQGFLSYRMRTKYKIQVYNTLLVLSQSIKLFVDTFTHIVNHRTSSFLAQQCAKIEVISFEGVTYDEYFYNTLNSLLLTVTIFTAYQMLFTYLVYFYHPMSVFHNNDVFEPLYKCLQMVNKLLIKQIIAIMFMKGLYNNLRMLFPLNWNSGYVFLRDKRHF